MKIIDLFCGAGGASIGYHLALKDLNIDAEIIGVDIKRQKDYPFTFIKMDALEYEIPEDAFFVHASPPCQAFSRASLLAEFQGNERSKINLIPETRTMLEKFAGTGGAWVIENVPSSPIEGITLCGSSFGLKVRRHRVFESNVALTSLPCNHKKQGKPIGVYGSLGDTVQGVDRTTGRYVVGGTTAATLSEAYDAMGLNSNGVSATNWRPSWRGLKESLPPIYTIYIGLQIFKNL